jgi:hypothetical protein
MPARTHDPIKAKQKRQKRIAIGGAVLLLAIVGVEGPGMIKQLHGNSSTPAWLASSRAGAGGAAGTSTPASPTPAQAPAGATAAAPSGGTTAPTPVLVSDQAPTAGIGRLPSFGTFASKDPFAAQVKSGGQASAGAGGATGGGGGAVPTGGSSPQPPHTTIPSTLTPPAGQPAAPAPTSAVIGVNGVLGSVSVGTDFPAASATVSTPLFHLVTLTEHTAKISIAGGSYADGTPTVTLVEGKPLTLENTADGTRYTLKLYPQGTPLPTSTAATTTAAPKKEPAATAPIVTTPLIPTTALTP